MIGLLFIAGWGGLLLLTFVLVIVFLSRPWHIGERIACTAMTLLIGLGIPFWDYIPAKMYFNDVCKNAGVRLVSGPLKGIKFNDLDMNTIRRPLDWNVVETVRTLSNKESGEKIAELRTYRISDGNSDFLKPWLSDQCPRPSLEDSGRKNAGHVVIDQFKEILNHENN